MMETIISPQNPKLRELRKLRDKKHRARTGLFAAEGEDLLRSALNNGSCPEAVYFDADSEDALRELLGDCPPEVSPVPVARDALDAVSSLGSGSRVIGIWRQRLAELEGSGSASVVIYLQGVSDPANVGSVIRSSDALVDSTVVLGPGTADPFGPKAVRASMGSIWSTRIAQSGFEEATRSLGQKSKTVALVPNEGDPLDNMNLGGDVMLCLGSERSGLPDSVVSACDFCASIPMRAGAQESLNVAVAAAIALYQCSLHRIGASRG